MAQKKIIVVVGATGAQGGGLAHAILSDSNSEFTVRAITRDPGSDKAKELATLGAEIVKADIDDAEGFKQALKGAYGAFFVTFFWAHYSPEKEMAEAQIMAKAAKEAGIKHIIWSTLEDVTNWVPLNDDSMPTLREKYKVPHFDGKGKSDRYFIDEAVPVTFMLASYYWENLIYFGMGPKRGTDGKLSITFPMGDKKMAGIAAEDIGRCAYGIFQKGESLIGKRIGIAGDQLSCAEMARAMSKALGEEVNYNEITAEQYRAFGFPGADDLGNMFQFYRDFDQVCNNTRDVKFSRELNPGLLTFEEWITINAKRLPID
jgi:uncharacterized protein YbjT (DUF2867 family)